MVKTSTSCKNRVVFLLRENDNEMLDFSLAGIKLFCWPTVCSSTHAQDPQLLTCRQQFRPWMPVPCPRAEGKCLIPQRKCGVGHGVLDVPAGQLVVSPPPSLSVQCSVQSYSGLLGSSQPKCLVLRQLLWVSEFRPLNGAFLASLHPNLLIFSTLFTYPRV